MRFPSILRTLRSLTLVAIALCAQNCGVKGTNGQPPPVSSTAPEPPSSATLPERAEAVASADAWAVQGTQLGGHAGAERLFAAAQLRERIFRIDHRDVDALEASELYAGASRLDPGLRCSAAIAAALLDGERRSDPGLTFEGVYRAQFVPGADARCKRRAQQILDSLVAYRPLPTVLAQLEAQGGRQGSSQSAQGSSQSVQSSSQSAQGSSPSVSASLNGVASGDSAPGTNDGVVVPTLGASRGPARVSKVERYGAPDAARVVILLSEPATYKVGFLQESSKNPRLFVDIEGTTYQGPKSFDVGGLVERVRMGGDGKHTRVVLDLNATAYRHVFYLPEPFRLIIDVSKEAPKHLEEVVRGPRPIQRVVLDPGHGGHDPGASGPSGLREKDVTLDIAHRAAPLIARELGISTLLTRDSDDYVALDERTARANAFRADLFISIHCNASEDGAGRGVMTFVLDDSRDLTSTRVAARENDASAEAAAELAGALKRGEGGLGSTRSAHFAELLQRSAIASLSPSYGDIPNSGIKRAGFYVLAGARMPAVLFETSFISNATGETRFNTGDFRQKIADAVVNAIRAYRDGL